MIAIINESKSENPVSKEVAAIETLRKTIKTLYEIKEELRGTVETEHIKKLIDARRLLEDVGEWLVEKIS